MPAGTGEHRQLQLFTIFYIKKQSDGKVFWGYGHLRPGYWERENVLQKETFAQFGRILYDQDDDVLKMTEEIFENTSREVLERIKGMMK